MENQNCDDICEFKANLMLLDKAERNLRSTQQFQYRLARLMDRCRNTLKFIRLAMAEKYNEKECHAIDDQLLEIEEWLRGREERPYRPFHPIAVTPTDAQELADHLKEQHDLELQLRPLPSASSQASRDGSDGRDEASLSGSDAGATEG